MGLLGAWVLFALAALVWWRRRYDSKKYAFTERAQVILDAIRDRLDVGIIYWSKSERKFIRRVVTPEELDGYSLRGFDHTLGRIRVFKVTRIRLIEMIPAGAPKRAPSRMNLVSVPMLIAVSLGGIALALLALALIRGHGPDQLTGVIAPQIEAPGTSLAFAAPVAPETDALKIADSHPDSPTNQEAKVATSATDPEEDDFLNAPPIPVKPMDVWTVVVQSYPKYKIGQVANTLQSIFRYRSDRAVELEQTIQTLGRAVVWSGPKQRAERYQQLLDGYDILATIEHPGSTNTTATVTNAVSVKAP